MWKSFLTFLILLSPLTVSAAGLVPCGGVGEEPCQLCHIGVTLALVGNWLATVMGIIVVLIIMVAGLRMATSAGDLSAMTNARRLISSAIIGYILFLAAWMLVDTGLRFLLNQPNYGVWNDIQCIAQPIPQTSSRPTASGDSASTLPPAAVEDRVDSINSSGSLQADIAAAAAVAGITDPDQVNTFRALIAIESTNCTNVVGPPTAYGTAYGCGQMLISTARGLDPSLASMSDQEVANRLRDDDAYNLTLSARYYNQLLERYNGQPDQTNLALAAYNGGPGANEPSRDCPATGNFRQQRRWQCVWDSPGCYGTGRTDCVRNTGYRETRNYVTNINAVAAGL